MDNSIRLWDLKSSQCVSQLDNHYSLVTSLSFCPDNETLIRWDSWKTALPPFLKGVSLAAFWHLCSLAYMNVLLAFPGWWPCNIACGLVVPISPSGSGWYAVIQNQLNGFTQKCRHWRQEEVKCSLCSNWAKAHVQQMELKLNKTACFYRNRTHTEFQFWFKLRQQYKMSDWSLWVSCCVVQYGCCDSFTLSETFKTQYRHCFVLIFITASSFLLATVW